MARTKNLHTDLQISSCWEHIYVLFTLKTFKYSKNKSRLQEFIIRKKTCSNFPFHQLDDSQFQKTVSKFHFGLRLQISVLIEEKDCILYTY
jgi:hypothetical protein